MTEKKVSDFYKEEVPSYASYDLIRKCSSYIDGFKNAHRKIIWTMMENFSNPDTRTKTSQMSATVSLALSSTVRTMRAVGSMHTCR